MFSEFLNLIRDIEGIEEMLLQLVALVVQSGEETSKQFFLGGESVLTELKMTQNTELRLTQNAASSDLYNCPSSCNAIESGNEMKLEDMEKETSKEDIQGLFI